MTIDHKELLEIIIRKMEDEDIERKGASFHELADIALKAIGECSPKQYQGEMKDIARKELIETAAKAMLRYNNFSEGCARLGTFEEVWEISKHHWLEMAEAALKAIGWYLPDVITRHEELYGDRAYKIECGSTAYDLYTKFKNICEGK